MNKIWFIMVVASLCALCWTAPSTTLSVMLNASTDAFKLSLELCAVYAVWLGVLEIVELSGLGDKLAKLLRPFIKKIFKINDNETAKMIALNMSANMLGLGNASTPLGLQAMKRLDKGSPIASHAIIMLIVLNATSIQLLPTTIIGLRASAGSANPADIILPTLLSTICTFVLGISLVLLCSKIREKIRRKNI
ncbi:MAG: spore maturation protein [Clostridiales bacterium]|nr:spore maturation protein [Clostridiales bacterium]